MVRYLVTIAVALVAGADAFWRMECPGRVGLARMDPIISPGESSAHLHAIHGSSGFSETSHTSDLLAGNCTSCRVTQDKSAYWHPGLYFQDGKTKQFELVPQVGGMLAYYLLYGENITAFPTDFRMISGNTERRDYTLGNPSQPDPAKSLWAEMGQTSQSDLAQRALGFNCLNYAKPPEGSFYRHYLPDKAYLDANCADGIRFEIMFPSCWKGGDAIDSPNHKDHVAFPDLVMTGNCPDGYPHRLPSLMYEIIWNTAAYVGRDGQFVIANGDTTGYGLHADFIMGWDESFLQSAVNTCTNPSGRIEDCPLFHVVDQGTATQCQLEEVPRALVKENALGPMAQLPGNVQITFGNGSQSDPSASVSVVAPTLTYKAGTTPSASGSPLPGEVIKQQLTRTATLPTTTAPPSLAAVQPSTTPDPVESIQAASTSYVSTEYITAGRVVTEVLWQEKVVTVTAGEAAIATPQSAPVMKNRRSFKPHHGHGHRHF